MKKTNYDYNQLKGLIRAKQMSYGDVAKAVGISATSMTDKLNNKKPFKQSDMGAMIDILEIDHEKIHYYFFTKESEKNS